MEAKLEKLRALIETVMTSGPEGELNTRRMMDADKVIAWTEGLLLIADHVDGGTFDLATQRILTKDDRRRLISVVAHAICCVAVDIARAGKDISCGHSGCLVQIIMSEAMKALAAHDVEGAKRLFFGDGLSSLHLEDDIGEPGPTKH